MIARQGIPFRPDPDAHRARTMASITRACLGLARQQGNPDSRPPKLDEVGELVTRAPSSPTRISDAPALAQLRVAFLPSLIPVSAAAAVLGETVQFSFDNVASIVAPSMTLPTAGWVGEMQAIPVLQGTTASVTLTPSKLATIIPLTAEMIEAGDAETVMEMVLLENIGAAWDAAFFTNAAAVAGVSCAGILNGAISVTAAAASSGAIVTDVANLIQAVAAVSGNSPPVLIAAPKQATAIKAVLIDPPPTYASNALAAGTVAAIVPRAVASASDAPIFSVSKETTLHMATPASDLVASPSTVAAPQRSIWQTDSFALKYRQELTWAKRGAGVALLTGANWP
jgi:hypothetical protein